MSDLTLAYAVRIESPLQYFLLGHLASSLRSASEQTVAARIVLVDYGTRADYQERLRMVATFNGVADIIRAEATEWSRSRALNLAVRCCETPYFAPMDADCLLPPNYTSTMLSMAAPDAFVLAAVRRLHETARTYSEALSKPARAVHPEEGHGLVCAPTEWLQSVRGYDEAYRIWGQEDSDLLARAHFSGLSIRPLPFHLAPQHLPHAGPEAWTNAQDVAAAKARNQMRYQEALRMRRTAVNDETWGRG